MRLTWMVALGWLAAANAHAGALGNIDFSEGVFKVHNGSSFVGLTGVASTTTCTPNGKMQRFGNEVYMCTGGVWVNPSCGDISGTCTVPGRIDNIGGTYCTCNGTNWLKWATSACGGGGVSCTVLQDYLVSNTVADPTTAADGVNGDMFGSVVAMDGTTAAIANAHSESGFISNTIYVYTYSGTSWSQQQEIAFTDDTGDYLTNMALSSNTLLVGGYDDAVYVYSRSGSTWSYTDTLYSPTYGEYDGFGYRPGAFFAGGSALAISGTVALVGDAQVFDDGSSNGNGFAALYTKSGGTWGLTATLTAADGANGDQYGAAVAFPGTGTLAVGALISGTSPSTGAVYVYTGSGASWSQQAKIAPSDVKPGDWFGMFGLALDGDTLAAGSLNMQNIQYFQLCAVYGEPYCSIAGSSGNIAAYIFHRSGSTWSQQGKLTTFSDDLFGPLSIGLKGDVAVVGGSASNSHGTSFYYTRSGSTWTTSPTSLMASDSPVGDGSGDTNTYLSTVAVDGCNGGVLMGTIASSPTLEIGNAYFFTPGQVAGTNPCTLPWGGSISSTDSVTAYLYGTDTSCPSQSRICNNGSLSGGYTHQSCTVDSDPCHSDGAGPGTMCSDGTVYAANISGTVVYATPCDAGKTYSGGACSGTNSTYNFRSSGSGVTAYTSAYDGKTNSAGLSALGSAYAAARYCEDLTANGYSDWYLPAYQEINAAIPNLSASASAFALTAYWSSTDATSANAYVVLWTGGSPTIGTIGKTGAYAVRCMRHN
jgi:hypothetical protein